MRLIEGVEPVAAPEKGEFHPVFCALLIVMRWMPIYHIFDLSGFLQKTR